MADWLLQLGFWPQLFLGSNDKDAVVTDDTKRARQAAGVLTLIGAALAAPVAYALYLNANRKKKRGKKAELTPAQERTGIALENMSVQTQDILKTMVASPYFALPLAYIGVQMLEDLPAARTIHHPAVTKTVPTGSEIQPYLTFTEPAWDEVVPAGIITRDLGNTIQSLLAISAAGPAIQGVAGVARSAFARGK